MPEITKDFVWYTMNAYDSLDLFQQEIQQGDVTREELNEYIRTVSEASHSRIIRKAYDNHGGATSFYAFTTFRWWGEENPDELNVPDAYFKCLIPTRYMCAVLITIANYDESVLENKEFADMLACAMETCAAFGLKYFYTEDLLNTEESFQTAKADRFVKNHPEFSPAFTAMVKTSPDAFDSGED